MSACNVDGTLVLRDPSGEREHHLNPVAGFIWMRCDGRRDVRRIAREVSAHYRKPLAEVARDVERVIAAFAAAGIVRTARGPRREIDVLLRCVREAIGTETPCSAPDSDHSLAIDWNAVVQIAYEHGVLPLLVRGLASANDLAPPPVLDRLRRSANVIASRNRLLFEELVSVLDAMTRAGVRATSLKGPTLAILAYGDVTLRSFGDLDVFVRPAQARDAIATLRSRGYRVRPAGETETHAELWRPGTGVHVDLQWALASRRFRSPVRLEDLWPRLEPVHLGAAVVWQPPPADTLLILCAHGAKHCWSRLQWIADLAAYIGRAEGALNWSDVRERAARAGGARQLLLGIALANQLLGLRAPADLVATMDTDRAVDPLASEVRTRLFDAVDAPQRFQGSYGPYRGGLFYVRTRERLRDRVPYLVHLALRPVRRVTTNAVAFVYRRVHARRPHVA